MNKFTFLFLLCLILLAACSSEFAGVGNGDSATTTQGSYANMIVVGDLMYVVNKHKLQTFSINDQANPRLLNEREIDFSIESLLHYKGSLFIGSPEGMFIFTLDEYGIPKFTSVTEYSVFSGNLCMNDPLAVNDEYAFASLSSKEIGDCVRLGIDEIKVFNIKEPKSPVEIQRIPMDSPRGIALDGNLLFVTEANQGLKVLDVSNPLQANLLYHFDGFQAYDVIANDGLLVVVGPEKIYEYDYSEIENMKFLSELDF